MGKIIEGMRIAGTIVRIEVEDDRYVVTVCHHDADEAVVHALCIRERQARRRYAEVVALLQEGKL
jgi:hypothetical protein